MTAPRTRRIRTGAVPPLVVLAVLAASTSGVDLLSDGSADPPSTTRSGGHPTASAPSLPSGYIGWLTRDGTGWGPNQFVQARTRLLRLPPI